MNPNTKLNKNNHITNTNTNDDYVKPHVNGNLY